jgi:hypothetical protein
VPHVMLSPNHSVIRFTHDLESQCTKCLLFVDSVFKDTPMMHPHRVAFRGMRSDKAAHRNRTLVKASHPFPQPAQPIMGTTVLSPRAQRVSKSTPSTRRLRSREARRSVHPESAAGESRASHHVTAEAAASLKPPQPKLCPPKMTP